MKRYVKKTLGVTLLEIMLVLAIAAMVIVMSIRYYQSATLSQQSNALMETLQAIGAAMDNLAVGSGSYASITTAQVASVMGGDSYLKTPWNTSITVAPSTTASEYTVTVPGTPASVCQTVKVKLTSLSSRYSSSSTCSSTGNFVYTYDSAL